MTKKSSQQPPTTPTQAPEQNQIPTLPIMMHGQYIKDLSFETPGPFRQTSDQAPSINLNVEVKAQHMKENTFEVELHLIAEAKQKDTRVFLVDLLYAGAFGVSGFSEENLRAVLLIECPRLLFPFARSILSDVTRDGGFAPLSLAPIDFGEMYRQQLNQAASTTQSTSVEASPKGANGAKLDS